MEGLLSMAPTPSSFYPFLPQEPLHQLPPDPPDHQQALHPGPPDLPSEDWLRYLCQALRVQGGPLPLPKESQVTLCEDSAGCLGAAGKHQDDQAGQGQEELRRGQREAREQENAPRNMDFILLA